ncbi:MAG: ABC transporter ATP-binding protein [Bacteroidota bacterium]
MATLRIEHLTKAYGSLKALDDVSLLVREGELLTVLGPSGSGKSTLVKSIAGFVQPDSGRILLDDRDITFERPEKRNTAMVFQSYALWPHMTVFDNISFGLRLRKLPQKSIDEKVSWALELVDLQGLQKRYPRQLSGGQQQRVALARALVVDPGILLLDEPLSNLDAKIRYRLRFEIKKLQRRLNITTIYITHDQEEALSIADSVVLLKDGAVLQAGAPDEIYSKPADAFVAEFLGASNVIRETVKAGSGGLCVVVGGTMLPAPPSAKVGDQVNVVIRADEVQVGEAPPTHELDKGYHVLQGRITDQMYLGSRRRYEMETPEGHYLLVDSNKELPTGTTVSLWVRAERVYIY